MKVLSIGNSFSEDAHIYLYNSAKERGIDLETVNIAIGGCSLQRHWENIVNNSVSYLYNANGGEEWEKDLVSVEQVLKSHTFDAVTLQQVSGYSGEYQSYQPYLNNIILYVRKYQPNAKLYIHRTWAYEIDSQHGDFPRYNSDQKTMYEAICKSTDKIANEIGASLILSGSVIQALREALPEFDYKNGGKSLCRDGFHLSDYGRFAVSLTWLATLTKKVVNPMPFKDYDIETINKTCEIVNKTVFGK